MRWLIIIILMLCRVPFFGQALAVDHVSNPQIVSGDSLTAEKLLQLSDKYTFSEPEKAKAYAEKAIALAKKADNIKGEIEGLYQLGSLYILQGDRSAAEPYFESGLENSREINDQFLMAQGYYHLSHFHEGETNFSEALDYLKQSFSIYNQLGRKKNMADCYVSFGRIYKQLGNYEWALTNLFQSLSIYEELDDQEGISKVKTSIGNVYLLTSEYDEALSNFSESLSISRSINDQEGIYFNMYRIGVAYQKKGSYEKALNNYKEALPIARRLNYSIHEAILLGNIGSTLRQQGKPEEALSYLFSSLKLRNEIDYNASHNLNDISDTYLELQNPKEAEKYALQAIESSKKRSDLGQLNYAYFALANAYEKQGDYRNAYLTTQLYNSTKDSLFSLEKARQMDELEVVYETEKKEQEIDLLTLQAETADFRRYTYLLSGIVVTFIFLLLYMGQRYKGRKNRQLLQKEQEVAEMKSNFFSNISHEFRTPLTLISGPIETMKAGTEDPKMKNQLETMQKNADRLLSLINQLLELSKLESGKLELYREPTDIVTLVKGVTMTFQSLAEIKDIDLTIETEVEMLELNIDQEKVETILINLINNAFIYTPKGGKITVSLGIEDGKYGNNMCRIAIKDTGKGISEQDLPHVFDRFYRGADSEIEQTEGTGIGLALTKELVELHSGSIEVCSKEKEWTEFVVALPLEDANYGEEGFSVINISESTFSANTQSEILEASEEVQFGKESAPILLLIEDNEDVMHYLKDILGDTYRVVEASNGEQGVESAFEHIPDLIISDVMMPKMSGYQVAETLKQDEKTSHIPLILLTAKADQKDKMQGLKAHADEYLTKPFKPEELKIRIQNMIESRKQLRGKYKREFMMRPDEISVHSMDDAFLLRVKKVVDEHIDDEDFTVEQLGKEVGMSRSQIHRKLVALTDQSATEFIRSYRLYRAKDMLLQETGSISEISYAVGFGSPSYFSKCFRKEFGFTPSETSKS